MFKTTARKAVLNGLGTFSSQNVDTKLTACKRSIVALTSLTAEDNVSKFS
jgi:hypothetical protein